MKSYWEENGRKGYAKLNIDRKVGCDSCRGTILQRVIEKGPDGLMTQALREFDRSFTPMVKMQFNYLYSFFWSDKSQTECDLERQSIPFHAWSSCPIPAQSSLCPDEEWRTLIHTDSPPAQLPQSARHRGLVWSQAVPATTLELQSGSQHGWCERVLSQQAG